MKTYIFLVPFLLLCALPCYAQNKPGGRTYLLFDSTSSEKCSQKQYELKKFRKEDTGKSFTFFYVCDELFVFNKAYGHPDTTSIKKIPKHKMVTINEMLNKYNSLEPQQFKHHVYDTLFIVEKWKRDLVLLYRVGWNDPSLGIVN